VALPQSAACTGADPAPDFARLVNEDLVQGRVVGESFHCFPLELAAMRPAAIRDPVDIVAWLRVQLGSEVLRERLIARFFELGRADNPKARERYASHGLDLGHRGHLGLALQRLLEQGDRWVQETSLEAAAGEICMAHRRRDFEILDPRRWPRVGAYSSAQMSR
jgi:hypothetical protein